MNASEMPATKRQIRLIIKCVRDHDHQKLLKFSAELGMDYVETFAGLLCGTSPHYVHKPGPNSPIGKCATCGGQIEYTIEEVEAKNAKDDRQHHEAGPGSL